jgi:hypothetical protein
MSNTPLAPPNTAGWSGKLATPAAGYGRNPTRFLRGSGETARVGPVRTRQRTKIAATSEPTQKCSGFFEHTSRAIRTTSTGIPTGSRASRFPADREYVPRRPIVLEGMTTEDEMSGIALGM